MWSHPSRKPQKHSTNLAGEHESGRAVAHQAMLVGQGRVLSIIRRNCG
jgi:hypothetical protein